MSWFQVILMAIVAALLVVSIVAVLRGAATKRESLVWISLWLAAAVAIAWPSVTRDIARLLGIGRGADLVLYCAVVVMMVGFLMIYIRLRHVRRELTLLVRHIAIRDAVDNADARQATTESDPSAADNA